MTAKARLEALLDSGVDEPDEALAEMVGCKASTIKAYRQEWQRRNGIYGQHLQIPLAAEVEVIALRNDGLTFPIVAQAIREQFGISLTADQARTVYRSGGSVSVPAAVPAEVDAADLPLATCSGLMWQLPARPPKGQRVKRHQDLCDVCPYRPRCARASADPTWYNGCERPLAWEVPQEGCEVVKTVPQ